MFGSYSTQFVVSLLSICYATSSIIYNFCCGLSTFTFYTFRGACMKHQTKKPEPSATNTDGPGADNTWAQPGTYPNQRTANYWFKCVALLAFLLLWTWFVGSQTGWWFLDSASRHGDTAIQQSGLEPVSDAGSSTVKSTKSTTGGGGGKSGGTTTTNNTTNNTTTTTTTTTGGGGGGTTTPPDDQSCTTTPQQLYSAIVKGQTKAQVLKEACNITPTCVTTSTLGLGDQEVCTFAQDNQEVIVVFLNGQEVTKTKLGF